MRERVPALALFEGVVDVDVLTLFSAAEGVPARFAGVAKDAWEALLNRLFAIGLVTPTRRRMYQLASGLAGLSRR